MMRYCKRMKRACSCGRLVSYDAAGNVREISGGDISGGIGCLTDDEMRSILSALHRETRERRMEAGLPASAMGYC